MLVSYYRQLESLVPTLTLSSELQSPVSYCVCPFYVNMYFHLSIVHTHLSIISTTNRYLIDNDGY